MKALITATIVTLVVLLSVCCNRTPAQQSVKTEPPVAVKAEVADISLTNTRGNNVVDNIYQQLIDKNPSLKELEAQIGQLEAMKSDSAKLFDDFNNSNNAYYASAAAYTADIKDSVLRVKIKDMLAQSQATYVSKTNQHTNIEASIGNRAETLNNLHIMLKLIKTMAAMEQYQNTNIPSINPLQNVLTKCNTAIAKTQQLAKK